MPCALSSHLANLVEKPLRGLKLPSWSQLSPMQLSRRRAAGQANEIKPKIARALGFSVWSLAQFAEVTKRCLCISGYQTQQLEGRATRPPLAVFP